MKHEFGEQLPPFPTIVIPETDLGWMSETERYEYVIDQLKQANLYSPDSLYCGIDASDIIATKTFGNRTETWAVDEAEFATSAADMDRFGDGRSGGHHNPLQYALTSGFMPALAVYDKSAFVNEASPDGEHTEYEWRLRTGQTMDQSTRAVIYLS